MYYVKYSGIVYRVNVRAGASWPGHRVVWNEQKLVWALQTNVTWSCCRITRLTMTDTIASSPPGQSSSNSGAESGESWLSEDILTGRDGCDEVPQVPQGGSPLPLRLQLPLLRLSVLWRRGGAAARHQEVPALVTGQLSWHAGDILLAMITFRTNPPRSLTWLSSGICRAGATWRRRATWRCGKICR